MIKRRILSAGERKSIYNMFNGHCAYCGCEITLYNMQVDHIAPLYNGGADELSNMFPACRSCNHRKHTLSVESFRQEIEKAPERLMRDSPTYRNAVRFGLVVHPETPKVVFYFEKVERQTTHENST